ncbi:MAG: hypothetical protein ACR2HH_13670 [Chthoniobacterales bacterium]
MPPEPKQSIEELLRASAEKRRAEFGAEPRMPNPLRARLHEEIARTQSVVEPRPRGSWWARFWPQLSLATAVAAVLVAGSVVWMKSNDSRHGNLQLAMGDAPNESRDAAVLLKSLPAAAPPETTAAGAGLTSPGKEIALAQTEARREDAGVAGRFASAPAPMAKNALTNHPQQFSQSARGQTLRNRANLQRAVKVLDNFQLEQEGWEIRLVDADGSTYHGEIVAAPSSSAAGVRAKTASRSFATEADVQTNNGLFFRASGFNSSLQKRVVFEGNYIPPPPNEQSKPAAPGQAKEEEPANARVVGTAQIAGEAPVAVDAIAVTLSAGSSR